MSTKTVQDWRKRTKHKLVQGFKNKCCICGYDRCITALDFHHVNPNEKSFNISSWKIKNWKHLVIEVSKCICLCSNCHRELHENIINLDDYELIRFDSDLVEIYEKQIPQNYCPVCFSLKPIYNKYCSYECRAKMSWSVNWDEIDLKNLFIEENRSVLSIAKELNISDSAVHKRLKKLKLK